MKKSSHEITNLIRSISQLVGNKVYLRDLEKLLSKVGELNPHERQTISFLSRDLDSKNTELNKKKYF